MEYKGYEDKDLITELPEWKKLNGKDFSIEDWLGFHGSPELTIAYSSVYCPDFEEALGGIFEKDCYRPDNLIDYVDKNFDGDCVSYQSFANCRDIIYLLRQTCKISANATQVEFLGNLLERIWGYQLKAEFPHLNTAVKYCGLDVNSLEEANITFWVEPKIKEQE